APPRDPHSFPTRRSSDLCCGSLLRRPATTGLMCPLRRSGWRAWLRLGLGVIATTSCGAGGRSVRSPWSCEVSRRSWLRIGLTGRSEEHTSELQSRENLVCRLLLEKKKQKIEEAP